MNTLAVVVRVIHLAFAIALAGGAAFQLLALRPALAALSAEQRAGLRDRLLAAWRPVLYAGMALLLLTGLVNFLAFKVPQYRGHPQVAVYHGLFGVKFLLALGVFHISTMLALPGERYDRIRDRGAAWLGAAAVLVVAILVVAAIMNNFERLFPRPAA